MREPSLLVQRAQLFQDRERLSTNTLFLTSLKVGLPEDADTNTRKRTSRDISCLGIVRLHLCLSQGLLRPQQPNNCSKAPILLLKYCRRHLDSRNLASSLARSSFNPQQSYATRCDEIRDAMRSNGPDSPMRADKADLCRSSPRVSLGRPKRLPCEDLRRVNYSKMCHHMSHDITCSWGAIPTNRLSPSRRLGCGGAFATFLYSHEIWPLRERRQARPPRLQASRVS